jgi:hypothetical protein
VMPVMSARFIGNNCRAFDSLAPARSPFGLPVHVAQLPLAPFCETPTQEHQPGA